MSASGYIAVFHQIGSRLDRACTHIHAQHWRGVDGPTKFDKLVRAKLIGFNRLPGKLTAAWALIFRPHSIQPVVATEEIAARIAHNCVTLITQRFYNILAKTTLICMS